MPSSHRPGDEPRIDRPRIDRLSTLLERFRVKARVVAAGSVLLPMEPVIPDHGGQLHILRTGRTRVVGPRGDVFSLSSPGLLFFSRALPHRLEADSEDAVADLLSADIDLTVERSPLGLALPSVIVLPLEGESFSGLVTLLLEEAFQPRCGRQTILDRLCEVLVVKLLRHLIETGATQAGLLAGLAHPGLARPLTAMHGTPNAAWSLERLADEAGMSRTVFANTFRTVVGLTPGEYLTQWRLTLARELITEGKPLKLVAREVGYESASALSRAISRRFGAPARSLKERPARGRDGA
ncbi:AraC family transcriptional regulator [Azospirillum sp. RWY-5-1]|uniref:AraC family transcriptional regulator n=1 Tax=Azospirillum oleiclasticum TaxID=2735135 RepID=A0ABX2T682_9PROT|nr:AraC family transcriptional regulator [Azospirillum oleiclasticum]NYZ12170.1 AraC family transcriptional regulator [Azospirillum oleiclasticum]NYZ19330.1 AraC family transcriptional regulator [Azospirillum oleiclasticum]